MSSIDGSRNNMSTTHSNATRTWTRKALWQTIENSRERRYSFQELQQNLEAHKDALAQGVEWYKHPNAESRNIVAKRAEKPKAEFIFKMSELMDLDEVQCESVLEACIKDDLEAPAVKRRIDWSNIKKINYSDENLVVPIQQQYLNEREETLLALTAIIRARDDEQHPHHTHLRAFVDNLFKDKEDMGKRLHQQLQKAIQRQIPPNIAKHPEWASTWAKQYVKEQRLVLQINFLFYYSVAECPPSTARALISTIVADFDFGRHQVNESLFDRETLRMGRHIADLCVMVIIRAMGISDLIDADDLGILPIINAPNEILVIYKVLEQRAGGVPNKKGDPLGPVLLAWGILMQLIDPAMEAKDDEEPFARLRRYMTQTPDDGVPSRRLPQILIQTAYMSYQAISYLVSALKGPLTMDEHMALGYKSLVKDLIMLLLEAVRDVLDLPDRDILITCLSSILRDEEQLSLEWWQHDYENDAHRSLLDAARLSFPIEFRPLIQLLTSLIGGTYTATYVFRYFKAMLSFADYHRPYDYVEDPFTEHEGRINVYRWKGNAHGLVYNAHELPFHPPDGVLAQEASSAPKILLLRFQYSGWHLLMTIVDSFLHAVGGITGHHLDSYLMGTPEMVTDILKLFTTLFNHADEELMELFIEHISELTRALPTWRDNTAEYFIGLVCQILNRACSFAAPPVELLTSCMACLRSLLKYFPDAVWKHLRTEVLFPRHSTSATSRPTNSYMEEVLLPAEIAAGQYPTTMAFLDFAFALIRDAQTLRRQDSYALMDSRTEQELWEAKRNPQLMDAFDAKVGGTDRRLLLEKELLIQAKKKESATLRAEVLYSAVVYIHSDIFPKHSTWRYARIHDRYQIGLKVLQIFNQIMWDSTWAHGAAKNASRGIMPCSVVQDYLAQSYLVDGSVYQITPLIDIVSIGNDAPLRFYRNLRTKTARTIEECIEHSLRFVKYLLKRRKIRGLRVSLLEHSLLDRTVHNHLPNDSMELVQVLGRYLAYENHRPLPLLATEVLTLLCAVAADWQPRAPSFAGYFGLDASNFVASIVKLLQDDKSSLGDYEELQSALYNFITLVIANQPGLAAMLLTGEASQPMLPTGSRNAPAAEGPTNSSSLSNLSVVVPAMNLLQNWQNALAQKPATLAAAMRMMDAVWQHAPEYLVILDKVRARPEVWESMRKLFQDDPEIPSQEPFVNVRDEGVTEEHYEVRRYCYSKQVRTYALRILAFEIYFTREAREGASILQAVQAIFEARTNEGNIALFSDDSRLPYRSDLPVEMLELARSLHFPIPLQACKELSWSDDFDVNHQFGDTYIYDLDVLRAKLRGPDHFYETDRGDEFYDEFLSSMCAVNHNRSLTDAHVSLVRAWKKFCKVLITTFTHAVEASRESMHSLNISSEYIYEMIRRLTEALASEHRDDPLVVDYRSEISELLSFLVGVWRHRTMKGAPRNVSAKQAVEIVRRLHECMGTQYYELGPPGLLSEFPFHIELLSAIVVTLLVLRATADEEILSNLETRRVLEDLLPVVCRGLSLLLQGLGQESLVAHERDFSVAFSCLSELVAFDATIPPSASVAVMDRHEIVPLLLTAFQRALSAAPDERPTLADNATVFMTAIAGSTLGSERLAVEGILACVSNNSFSPTLMEGAVQPYIGQERNPWHRLWCAMLSIVTRIVQSLGDNPTLVQEVSGFIRVYQKQFVGALDVASDGDLSLGRVDEICRITELFYALASWADRRKPTNITPTYGHADYSILQPYQEFALQLLGYFTYIFDNPNEMNRRMIPVSRSEKESSSGNAQLTAPLGTANSRSQKAFSGAGLVASGDNQSPSGNVHVDMARGMLFVVRNVITYLRLSTSADEIIVNRDERDQDIANIFQATMSLHGGKVATMGTLFDLIRRVTTLLRSILDRREGESREAHHALDKAASYVPTPDLLLIIECGIVLAVTQVALYKRIAEADETTKELIGELDPTVKEIDGLLRNARERDRLIFGKKELERAIAFVKLIEEFRLREFGRM